MADRLAQFLEMKFGEAFIEVDESDDVSTIHIRGTKILELLRMLKTDPRFAYNFLADITAVDHLKKGGHARYSVVYHLLNQHDSKRIVVHAWIDEEDPLLPSVTALWRTADWQEREVFDLFGIKFDGHPDLRKILNPDSFQYHPLRKDYPLQGLGERDDFKVVKRSIGSKWVEERSFE
ncbi:MAG: NADH-quinone oxidoreductase subunit C [Candidatus Marinimicrobia bacterium]|nr:NADH-quinone oxidoreductase subunit C [Candidatus Neomarinimicrobiota bacterium]